MSPQPFEAIGDEARWVIIYRILRKLAVDEVMTYKEMGEALDLDPDTQRAIIRSAFQRAAQELEQIDRRAVSPLRGVGYRVVPAVEHLSLARQHGKKANRSIQRALGKVTHVDLSNVDPEVRAAFQIVATAFAEQAQINKRFATRQLQLERSVAEMTTKVERTDEERQEILARLAKLEKSVEA